MQTSKLFQKEQIQVQENWQEKVLTALSDPTDVGEVTLMNGKNS